MKVTTGSRRFRTATAAQIELPLAGQWDVHLAVERAGDVWRATRRVYLRP